MTSPRTWTFRCFVIGRLDVLWLEGKEVLVVTVQISSATRDLMLIQHNQLYWISNRCYRSGVVELIWAVTVLVESLCHNELQNLSKLDDKCHWWPMSMFVKRRCKVDCKLTGQFADKPTRHRSSCGLVNWKCSIYRKSTFIAVIHSFIHLLLHCKGSTHYNTSKYTQQLKVQNIKAQ